jgi:transposase
MLLKTILNRVQKFKSFVYHEVRWGDPGQDSLEVQVEPRSGSRPNCSGCFRPGPGYDRLDVRRFEFVPLWNIKVFLVYSPRRVDCRTCGVRVEAMPWTLPHAPKSPVTEAFAWFLAGWAKRLSWKETAQSFSTTWDTVFLAVQMAVDWGREHMDLSGIGSIGIDEIAWQKGHRYLTLVYQIDVHRRRLLWIGRDRKVKTLLRFFRWFGKERSQTLRFIASDLWKPYLKVIAKKAGQAIHVLDRFHLVSHFGKAIDEVRAQETRELKSKGKKPFLTKSRWLLLKRPEHLTGKQETRLAELVKHNLKAVRSYLLKEEFQRFWEYVSPFWAGKFLDRWVTRTLRSRIEPMKKIARMLRNHRELLLNWFRAKGQISSGTVEGFNTKAKLTARKAYGFRTFQAQEIALYHALGDLPMPKFTHRFF